MKTTFIFLIFILSFSASATPAGGDILICPGQPNQVLDYYYAALPGPLEPEATIIDVNSMQAQEVIDLVRTRLADSYFGFEFERVYREIGNLDLWMMTEGLSDVNDDGSLVKYPNGCTLGQGAAREAAAVYLDKYLIEGVPQGQIGVLALHEILYALAKEKKQLTSVNVRPVIRVLLQKKFDAKALAGALKDMQWAYSAFTLIDDRKSDYPQYHYDDLIFQSQLPGGTASAHIKSVSLEQSAIRMSLVSWDLGLYWWIYFECSVSGQCRPTWHINTTFHKGTLFPTDMVMVIEGPEVFILRIPSWQKEFRFLRQRRK